VVLAIALIAILPFLALAADRSPVLEGPWPVASRRTAFVCGLSLSLLFLAVGWWYPAKPLCIDSPWFAIEVYLGKFGCMRWYLTLATYTPLLRVAEWIAPFKVPARTFVTVLNAFASGAAYVLLLGCARRLGRDRFEVVAITLLTWGAFGNFHSSSTTWTSTGRSGSACALPLDGAPLARRRDRPWSGPSRCSRHSPSSTSASCPRPVRAGPDRGARGVRGSLESSPSPSRRR
jgi:hypothetical protein